MHSFSAAKIILHSVTQENPIFKHQVPSAFSCYKSIQCHYDKSTSKKMSGLLLQAIKFTQKDVWPAITCKKITQKDVRLAITCKKITQKDVRPATTVKKVHPKRYLACCYMQKITQKDVWLAITGKKILSSTICNLYNVSHYMQEKTLPHPEVHMLVLPNLFHSGKLFARYKMCAESCAELCKMFVEPLQAKKIFMQISIEIFVIILFMSQNSIKCCAINCQLSGGEICVANFIPPCKWCKSRQLFFQGLVPNSNYFLR